jgi:hypothetical protein
MKFFHTKDFFLYQKPLNSYYKETAEANMRETLKHLLFMERALGKYLAVANHLGYTERQYYNIRRRAKKGRPSEPGWPKSSD